MVPAVYAREVTTRPTLDAVKGCAGAFAVSGAPEQVRPHGTGHIHDSFVVSYGNGVAARRLLVQRLNQRVLPNLDAVMDNLARVTEHLRARLQRAGVGDLGRRVLQLVPTRAGQSYLRAADGECYRAFELIEDSVSGELMSGERAAFEAGRAFGDFQLALLDLPAPPLRVTIPGFHDTAARLTALRVAAQNDPCARAADVLRELDEAEAHAPLATLLSAAQAKGALPERIAHNDAKLGNLLFDARSERALCVLDLDTVMPGLWLHDFGDLVRVLACSGAEDARDLDSIQLREPMYAALARGYVEAVGAQLSDSEWELLPVAGAVISFELALRFLTDHLQGDRYFKIAHPSHNLQRARAQLRVLQRLEHGVGDLRALTQALRVQ